MKKLIVLILITSLNLYSYDNDMNLKNQIKRMTNAILTQDTTVLNEIFDFPLDDEYLVLNYNLIFNTNITKLNELEFSHYLKYTFSEDRHYCYLLKRINYNSLMDYNENCNLLYESENDTCNIMCCIKINDNVLTIEFYKDNTNDLIYSEKKNDILEEECSEYYESFVFEIINKKLKFIRFECAG